MKITKIERTDITLSRKDVEEIVKAHLAMKHFTVESMRPSIKTVYDGSMGDPGTEEFVGYDVTANFSQSNKEIEI